MVDLEKIRAERTARGLTVSVYFPASCTAVTKRQYKEGAQPPVTFASEEMRDDFIRRVRNHGGRATIL